MTRSDVAKRGPLAGVRVLDMTTSYAGPTATMYLADMGCDVIKLERPTGDDCRAWGPPFVDGESAWYASANRGKRSIGIDLRDPRGRALLDELLSTADVFVQSLNPTKLAQLDLEPEVVRARFPHLVYCCLSGFGLTGTDSDKSGYDLIAQARSGLMSVTGEQGREPQRMSTALCDIVTGITAAFAISAHLAGRDGTRSGALLDISLMDVGLALMAPRIAAYAAGDLEPRPSGATDSVLGVYQSFVAKDRSFVLAVGNDRMWLKLCEELGLDDLRHDARLSTNAGRREHRDEIVGELSQVFVHEVAAHWVEVLMSSGIPASLVLGLSEVVHDPHVVSRGSLIDVEGARGQTFQVVNHPWRSDRDDTEVQPIQALGANTVGVLADCGLDDVTISDLLQQGVVWASQTTPQ